MKKTIAQEKPVNSATTTEHALALIRKRKARRFANVTLALTALNANIPTKKKRLSNKKSPKRSVKSRAKTLKILKQQNWFSHCWLHKRK
jgi:hypothetical protein